MQSNRPVFYPPVEADSLFLRVTNGCSYNQCSFCGTYRDIPFRVRPFEEIKEEVDKVRLKYGDEVRRIFLGDGDAVVMESRLLRKVLRLLSESFPHLQQVCIYAAPAALLGKSQRELAGLRKLGLESVYMGIESGSDKILDHLNKGVNSERILKASRNVLKAGMTLSALVLIGAGGRHSWKEHTSSTGKLLSRIDPQTIIMLTLVLVPNTPLFEEARKGAFTPPTPVESVLELKELITCLDVTQTIFKSNHASNYLKVSGVLPMDKEKMLHKLERVLNNPTEDFFNPDYFRGS